MQILVDTNYDFMGKRKIGFVLSALALAVAIGSLLVHGGPKYSIDFTGGSFVQMAFTPPLSADALRSAVTGAGINAEIQQVSGSNEYIIRMKNEDVESVGASVLAPGSDATPFAVVDALVKQSHPDSQTELLRQEKVGPKIGGELRNRAVQAIILALVLMLGYIAFRFHGLFFALGAVAALAHDVLIVLGIFSLTGKEVSLSILAALLTIAGYSINDTIVVFDRIREQMKSMRKGSLEDVFNLSINRTLSRTVLTSLTTLFAVFSLHVFGGSVIHDFAFAVLCGVVVGTYSSIFVAAALVLVMQLWWNRRERTRSASGAQAKKAARGKTKKAQAAAAGT